MECVVTVSERRLQYTVDHPGDCGFALYYALKVGAIKPARGQICVDCGRAATVLEHRDYCRPLDVDPTCHRCNMRRGPVGRPWNNGHVIRAFSDSLLDLTTEPFE